MGPPRPRPSSPTTLFRQQILGQSSHQQQQPQPPDASPQALPMPLSATTGARRPPLPPPAVAGSSTSLYVPPARTGGRALRSRPNDVDELGRKPGTVDLPGTSSASASKRRRVEAPAAAAAGPSRRRFIPPPPLPRPGEDPDEEAEPASEYSACLAYMYRWPLLGLTSCVPPARRLSGMPLPADPSDRHALRPPAYVPPAICPS